MVFDGGTQVLIKILVKNYEISKPEVIVWNFKHFKIRFAAKFSFSGLPANSVIKGY